jgi:hypothetical protein
MINSSIKLKTNLTKFSCVGDLNLKTCKFHLLRCVCVCDVSIFNLLLCRRDLILSEGKHHFDYGIVEVLTSNER